MQFLSMRQHSGLAMLLAALLTACQPKAISMTPEETQHVEALTANMTTRCVGRYLIDMPQSFVLNSESSTVIEGVKIEVRPLSRRLFEIELDGYEAELRRKHIIGKPNRPFLKRIEAAPVVAVGKVFNRAEGVGESELGRTLELLAWRDGYEVRMSINATDGTDIPFDTSVIGTPFENSGRRIWAEYKDRNDTPEKLAHLLKVYERVSGRKDNEIPSIPGLCIPNGFVAGADREGQDTGAVYHLSDAPDVWFGVTSDGTVGGGSTLFERSSELEKGMKQADVKTLRRTARSMHGEDYEEWLFTNTPYQDDVRGTKFVLHGNEAGSKPDQPFIKLALYNGDRIPVPELSMQQKDKLGLNAPLPKATLTEAEALAIWDKVSATLRLRPNAY
jgi:hypothetical protein